MSRPLRALWIVAPLAVLHCSKFQPDAPPAPWDCTLPIATALAPGPPAGPNIAGTTRWFTIARWLSDGDRVDGRRFRLDPLDVDGREICGDSTVTCTPKEGTRRKKGGDDQLSTDASVLEVMSGSEQVVHRQYLLRLDDVGGSDDSLVHAALYTTHAPMTPGAPWIVDAESLEDGRSLDKPRYRLADGYVRDGKFWSVGKGVAPLPVFVGGLAGNEWWLQWPIHPLALTMPIGGGAGRFGGLVRAADADAALSDFARRNVFCNVLPQLLRPSPDLVEASLLAPNAGVPCDALSAGFGFDAQPIGAPTAAGPALAPASLSTSDVCLGQPKTVDGTPSSPCAGCTVGVAVDGRVDITAAGAWPDRVPEPPLPPDDELAADCSTLAACLPLDAMSEYFPAGPIDKARASFGSQCASVQDGDGNGGNAEDHAVPLYKTGHRLATWLAIARVAKADCAAIVAKYTFRPELDCSNTGCGVYRDLGAITCSGTDATFASPGLVPPVRHCADALTTCSATSPTGCTDRPRIACPKEAWDRCDGNVLLGCTGYERVSFRDCGRYGGTCVETADGARCKYPSTCVEKPTCSDGKLTLCTRGRAVVVDCKGLGFLGCVNGHCQAP